MSEQRRDGSLYEALAAIRAGEDVPARAADMVNRPPHYTHGAIECIDAIESALGPDGSAAFLRGQVIKYIWRSPHKGGVEDLRKAEWYLRRLIDRSEANTEAKR